MAIAPNKEGANNAHMIYIPVVVFSVICPLLIGLRVWSRLRKGGGMGSDDHCIIVSLVFALASSGLMIASCQYGFGQHLKNLLPENRINAMMYFFLTQITYKASINLTKCSILLLYCRIFGNVRRFKWACYFLTACVAIYAIASVVATIFQCTPIQRGFNKQIPGTCINNEKFWYANAAFSVATDLLILFMPMPLVYQLQIPRLQKIALLIVFTLGGFVVITSCFRMTTINITATSPDITFDIASTMWTIIEMNIAIVCACLPMVRPLIVKFFPKLMGKSGSGSSRNQYGYGGQNSKASRGYISSHSRERGEQPEWSRVDDEGGINMTTIRKGDQSSEEYILHEAKSQPEIAQPGTAVTANNRIGGGDLGSNAMSIQKTVQYSIEYSKPKHSHTDWP